MDTIPDKPPKPSSKTDFERYLNSHPAVDDPRYTIIRSHNKRWGSYLRWKYPSEFNAMYDSFWLKNPELWAEAYIDNEPDTPTPWL
jgi:hypothetical protein